MGPRREDPNDAALRQRTESNNTLNQFLGASTRRYSWLNGDGNAVSPRRAAVSPSNHRTPPQPSEAHIQLAIGLRDASSTSASPSLPNKNVPVPAPQANVSSISPPQTPPIASTNLQTVAVPQPSPPQTTLPSASSPSTSETTLKRKEMEGHRNAVPLQKRLSTGGSVASSINSPVQGVFPVTGVAQNTQPRQLSIGTASNIVTPQSQAPRHVSSPIPSPRGWQQPNGPPISIQTVHKLPAHRQGQGAQGLPRNASLGDLHQGTRMQQPSTVHVNATSPTLPNPGQPCPSPMVQAGRTWIASRISPRNPYPWFHQGVSNPQQVMRRPPLPPIDPYTRQNCENHIIQYRQRRQHMGLPPLQSVETARLELLTQAAIEEDSLFLFIHQLVSLCATGSDSIPSVLLNARGFTECMALLNNLLAGGHVKDADLLDFFGKLPCTLVDLASERSVNYQRLINYMLSTSQVLPEGWTNLKATCTKRGYPPLATELWMLNVLSPTLMEVFLLASLRQVWFSNDHHMHVIHESAKQLFKENRDAVYMALVNGNLPHTALQHLGATYHQKFSAFAQQAQQRAFQLRNTGPSTHSSPSVITFPVNPTGAQPTVQQAPSLHRASSQQFQNNSRLVSHNQAEYISASVAQPVQQNGLLIPVVGAPRPDQVATATWQLSALHQAHLRDPRFTNELVPTLESELLYQFVNAFAIGPTRLSPRELYQTITFTVPESERVAQTTDTRDGQRKLRHLEEGVMQYRLRFVKVGEVLPGSEDLSADWVLRATSWPSDFYYTFNGQMLEVRRKQHHTKDLPIDITDLIRPNGAENTLEIFMNVAMGDPVLAKYAYAIEIVAATKHKTIVESCQSRIYASEMSLRAITDTMNYRASAEDDDEMIIDDAKTNITIFDPISQGKICETPVRGKNCKHRECFDLLTFLQSRPRERPGWPSSADSWKCPICLADVRPQHIMIDGFLKEVRDKLVNEGRGETRAIVVESDGSWLPKIEERMSSERSTPEVTKHGSSVAPLATSNKHEPASSLPVVSTFLEAEGQGMQGKSQRETMPKKHAVVIDLSEDD